MNKLYIYGLLTLLSTGLMACSDDEEILEPTIDYADNLFEVPADATGPEAELRREFYDNTGAYLLFNDVLSRKFIGMDSNGKEIWQEEKIDFLYNFTSYSAYDAPEFDYLETQEDKETATALIEKYILPHIEGSKLFPFSIMPVKSLRAYSYDDDDLVDAYTVSCVRCLAIATGEWGEAAEDDRAGITAEILYNLVSSRISYRDPVVKPFYDASMEYSGYYMYELEDDWDDDDPDITKVYGYGFLSYKKTRRGVIYLPYTSEDFNTYLTAVLGRDESDFMAEFGEYPAIVAKYNYIKDAIKTLGYKF